LIRLGALRPPGYTTRTAPRALVVAAAPHSPHTNGLTAPRALINSRVRRDTGQPLSRYEPLVVTRLLGRLLDT
jgi:hypothetical protein